VVQQRLGDGVGHLPQEAGQVPLRRQAVLGIETVAVARRDQGKAAQPNQRRVVDEILPQSIHRLLLLIQLDQAGGGQCPVGQRRRIAVGMRVPQR